MMQALALLSVWLRSYSRNSLQLFACIVALGLPGCLLLVGLAISHSLQATLERAPQHRYLLLANGAGVESRSFFAEQSAASVLTLLGAGAVVSSSPSLVLDVVAEASRDGVGKPLTLRGQRFDAQSVSRLLAGRAPRPGALEVAVTPTVAAWLSEQTGAADVVFVGRKAWRIVGVIADPQRAGSWELCAAIESLQVQFRLEGLIGSISMELRPAARAEVESRLDEIKALGLELISYRRYVERSSRVLRQTILTLWAASLALVVLCSVVACVMLGKAVAIQRQSVIATLHALGYGIRHQQLASAIEGAVLGLAGSAAVIAVSMLGLGEHSIQAALPGVGLVLHLAPTPVHLILVTVLTASAGALVFGHALHSTREEASG